MKLRLLFVLLLLVNVVGATTFNVEIDLPENYRTVAPEGELWFTTKLLNLENDHRLDVTITYQLLDTRREIVYAESETVAIETQASFVSNLPVPSRVVDGMHYLRVLVTSPYGESEAETSLQIVSPQETISAVVPAEKDHTFYIIGGLLLLLLYLIYAGSGNVHHTYQKMRVRSQVKHIVSRKKL